MTAWQNVSSSPELHPVSLETWVGRHRMVLDRFMMRRCVSAFETHNRLLL